MKRSLQTIAALALLLISHSSYAVKSPWMREITHSSGIEHQYTGGWDYYVGGGVAVFDCNDDHYPELFIAGGATASALFINQSTRAGNIQFLKASDANLHIDAVTGAYPLDIDSDGILDLAILRVGENLLYRGLGNCRFENANQDWQYNGGNAWTTAFSAFWDKGQKRPTLAFGNYVDRDLPGSPFGTCHDTDFLKPDKNGLYSSNTALTPGYCALSALFTDWNRDGNISLRVSNDRQYYRGGHEQLWRLSESDDPIEYGPQDGWRKLKVWGMGLAAADITGNGKPEYFITSMADNKLRTLTSRDGRPIYDDIALEHGLTAHRPFVGDNILPSTAWHAQFDDVNNDSYTDLLIVKGNIEAMQDFANHDPNNLLLGSPDGKFTESAELSNMLSFYRGRGGSLVDLNLDGLLDVVIVNREENIQIWQNFGQSQKDHSSPMGNWLALAIRQNGINPNAIGAHIEVRIADRTQTREITVGGGHAGGKASWHHFGAGVAERAIARVQWPDGKWSPWIRLFANQFSRISKNKAIADIWIPGESAHALETPLQ